MSESEAKQVDLVIENGVVVTMDADRRILAPGHVVVNEGRIVAVGPGKAVGYAGRERIDATDTAVLPGLVNAHNHLDQVMYRGVMDERTDSRNRIFQSARGLTRQRARAAAELCLLELVQFGVTTTHESHWTHYHPDSTDGICDAIRQSGMRAIVARSMNDKAEYTPAEYLERCPDVLADLDRLEREYESDYITIIAEPTTMLRCEPDTIHALRDWCISRGKIWRIHMAHDHHELNDALKAVGMGCVQYAKHIGVLGPEMQPVHCAGILPEEVDLMAEYQVRFSHCPQTIIRMGEMVPPIWELEQKGARVAIGTDGSATNNGQNLWESMKLAVYMQRIRAGFDSRTLGSAEQALEMTTIKAATVLNKEKEIGSLEVGKRADIAIFRRDQPHLIPDTMLIRNMVYSSVTTKADRVIVGGKTILQNGHSTMFDEAAVIANLREAQTSLLAETGMMGEVGLSRVWPVIHS